MKSGKWGSSLTLPFEGLPISLGANFSEDQFSEFRNRLLKTTQFNVKSDFYKTSFSTIPNTNLYQAYVDCQKIDYDVSKTGFIQGTNIETENTVVFAIYYRPQSPNDPMPIVKSFNVEPTGSVISGNLVTGQELNSFSLLVTCKRDQEKDLVLSLNTDRGLLVSKSVAEGAFTSASNIPIGTIITSYLNFEQFNAATKNNEKSLDGIWTSSKSKWSPCDGRPVPNSKFQTLTSQNILPDLRGMFIRGLNIFDPYQPVLPISEDKVDPDSRVVGSFQNDLVGSHSHGWTGKSGNGNPNGSLDYIPSNPTDRVDAYVRQPNKDYSESGVG
ncbi:hypothetical protein [Lacihabitans soyangensis]|uniref:Tail fiber protein n=1 Tax=Lacihabitans soyangensis TaxID=869394 RepID=A0AAE3H1K1_9BACT|nr:hypothetical protein [Lacihabitans soyangensis]MCP9762316.1 hypothetical protein [Lacihabitans soyangensis]